MARMSWKEACQLDTSLVSLDSFFHRAPEFAQTLTGGLTNRCWKVVLPSGQAYVWRPITPITKAFSISRHQEYQILKAIEPSGIAPAPSLVNDQGLLVEWVDGEALHQGMAVASLIETLAAVHDLDIHRIPVAPFNFTARVDHYWMQLDSERKTERVTDIYQRWRSAPNLRDVGKVLCHFDLAGYNLVATQTGTRVIDWEYASLADPRLDLTLTIGAADLPMLEAIQLYCQQRDIQEWDDWVEGVMAWQPRTQMMAMLWYLLAHQLWGEESYGLAAQQLEASFCS